MGRVGVRCPAAQSVIGCIRIEDQLIVEEGTPKEERWPA
jgi:hypothetical protein